MESPHPSSGTGHSEARRHSTRRYSTNGRQSGTEIRRKASQINERQRRSLEHTGAAAVKGRRSGPVKAKRKVVLFSLLSLLLLGGIAASAVFLIPMLLSGDGSCGTPEEPAEYKAIICKRFEDGVSCDFDATSCDIMCPLGLATDKYRCVTSCDCAVKGVFESDISFDENNLQPLLAAYMTVEDHSFNLFSGSASKLLKIWNNRVGSHIRVPYVMNKDLDENVVAGIKEAIAEYSKKTCIDFVLRTTESDYLSFGNGLGCSTSVSRLGGEQKVILGYECHDVGAIIHEIMHTLGFWHEHSRPDRDQHVRVMWSNIAKADQHNFNKRSLETIFDFGSPYDNNSIMHGGGLSFGENGEPAMLDQKTEEVVKAQRKLLSEEDVVEINSLYECPPGSISATVEGAQWGEWSERGYCSVTCGTGEAYKIRECLDEDNNPIPHAHCGEDYTKAEFCDTDNACINGAWSPWTPCDQTCGDGKRFSCSVIYKAERSVITEISTKIPRQRNTDTERWWWKSSCCGENGTSVSEDCRFKDCTDPASTFWAEWQEWGDCLRTCGNGMRRRYRSCFDMFETTVENLRCPQIGIAHLEIGLCAPQPCPDSKVIGVGSWTDWGTWGECTRTCDNGSQERTRICIPAAGSGVKNCIGNNFEVTVCNSEACPEIPLSVWTPWSPWTDCSETCGGGIKTRSRYCQSPVPITLETDCGDGPNIMELDSRMETCNNEDCNPKEAMWAEWGSWGECSNTCNGNQWRLRKCVGGSLGDPGCPWEFIHEGQPCNEMACQGRSLGEASDGSSWAPWYSWSECTVTCGGGTRERYRLCQTKDKVLSYKCRVGINVTKSYMSVKEQCSTKLCGYENSPWTDWTPWTVCPVTCGRGIRKRQRICLSKAQCSGPNMDSKLCIHLHCAKSSDIPGSVNTERAATMTNEQVVSTTPQTSTSMFITEAREQGIFSLDKLAKFFGKQGQDKRQKKKRGKSSTSVSSSPMFQGEPWSREDITFCDADYQLYLGDFNGDGRSDLLCLTMDGAVKISYAAQNGTFEGVGWGGNIGFCRTSVGKVYVGDFNGDGSQDLMCFQKQTGLYGVIFSSRGRFDNSLASLTSQVHFCNLSSDTLFVADTDNDGKWDLVCRTADGQEQIIFNSYSD